MMGEGQVWGSSFEEVFKCETQTNKGDIQENASSLRNILKRIHSMSHRQEGQKHNMVRNPPSRVHGSAARQSWGQTGLLYDVMIDMILSSSSSGGPIIFSPITAHTQNIPLLGLGII